MSDDECERLKQITRARLTKSQVVDSATGVSKDSDVRTSYGTFLAKGSSPLVSQIEARIATVSMIPKENGEGLQILRYQDGQKYEPHFDYFHDNTNKDASHGGQRIATMLMYLSTPEEGGETVFPNAGNRVSGPGWSECAKKGLAYHPVQGDGLLFFSLTPDGREDPASLHGSCPVTKGEKWSATKWMHVNPFGATLADKVANGAADCIGATLVLGCCCTAWQASQLAPCPLRCRLQSPMQRMGKHGGVHQGGEPSGYELVLVGRNRIPWAAPHSPPCRTPTTCCPTAARAAPSASPVAFATVALASHLEHLAILLCERATGVEVPDADCPLGAARREQGRCRGAEADRETCADVEVL